MNLILLTSTFNSVLRFITAIIVFIVVLGATYATTRFIGNYQKKALHSSNFDVIDSYRLSTTKYLQLMRIGNEYIVIAVCKDTVTMLCKVDKDTIILHHEDEDIEKKDINISSFKDMFEQIKKSSTVDDKDENDEDSKEV